MAAGGWSLISPVPSPCLQVRPDPAREAERRREPDEQHAGSQELGGDHRVGGP
jgi:hypothetical protein